MTLFELSTDLSGRYVSFIINPLSFKEVVNLTHTKEKDYEKILLDIFKEGSLGIKQIKTNSAEIYYSVALKNVVYNDLIGKDYKLFIGKIIEILFFFCLEKRK